MQKLVNHLKNSGFVFQGSEIYGGLANTWDYGPLGALLKDNIEKKWKENFIFNEANNYLIDSKILMNPQVWVTSGHVANFSDPLIENKVNGKRYRADKLIQEIDPNLIPEKMTFEQMRDFLNENLLEYENSKAQWSEIRKFNLMFETKQGVTEDTKATVYLRPETAQGIFVNFKNVQRTMRAKLPLGIGQVGKSFRNEVTPGNFIFRTREFEQMELEVFTQPEQADSIFNYYIDKCYKFALELGIKEKSLRIRKHDDEELAHYSKGTSDIEFNFPFGWGELLGVANRSDFDLKSHMQATGESLEYLDPSDNKKIIPWVIEPSMGLDRMMLAVLADAYNEEQLENDERIVLKLAKDIAPYKFAVLPLVKKLNDKASEVINQLKKLNQSFTYDEAGSIGKRYRRQDAIGTYYCLTIDYDSLDDNCVTVRNRDTMEQIRISIDELHKLI
ncbi:glycine--tRNA ligase [Mycoplasmopsis pullorum]|uniref:glycine--tRNA ligase n=1 Tax=Mycoplasmopsis pullorum TaxID=48003 RepID=A0A1L4FRA6_9BACT|nr:glycine--tRNA ligase [Mycoplasmopsis pullorum]APJ38140.1 glycine--tRNA ligase [Mycoplasmopsis pullorum]TNK81617.1 glycine--tRNA ligase [Mycoplasmopsis pullorum]TNK82876.1 glycine--tRNA ligase [Mycoplasmopsis pullorum]TNK83728.1 glycine--tRNA ligase [Mycoplasmopsis pullorum]TNK84163.1 glycine--tRNA ligase [Mycoplasmopsis pullorum]